MKVAFDSKGHLNAGFGAFFTACLSLCDVHVSKGRLLHLDLIDHISRLPKHLKLAFVKLK